MTPDEFADALRPWLRAKHAPAYEAALTWVWPRCRTEEERWLAPAVLLLLAPLNALVVPCRPAAGSCVNFQVTLSREGATGPERIRLTVRAASTERQADRRTEAEGTGEDVSPERNGELGRDAQSQSLPELWLDAASVSGNPVVSAAQVLARCLTEMR